MLKSGIISLGFIMLAFQLMIAQSFIISPDTSIKEEPAGGTAILVFAYVHNLTSDTINLVWEKSFNDLPPGWHTSICDEWVCHDTSTLTSTFFIEPLDSSPIVGHFIHNNIPGTGTLQLLIYNPDDSLGTVDTVTYIAEITAVSIENELISDRRIAPFPNPFTVETTITWDLSQNRNAQIFIFDVSGKQIQSHSLLSLSGEQIIGSNLSSGLYFYRLINEERIVKSGKIIKVK